MCRSIVVLRGEGDEAATPEEVEAAALQFVRKVSGYRVPSKANQEAFDAAVGEVTDSVQRLLEALVAPPGVKQPKIPRSRQVAREKRRGATLVT